jgi:hypothetical protein
VRLGRRRIFAPGRVRDPKGSAEKRSLLLLSSSRYQPARDGTHARSDERERGFLYLQEEVMGPSQRRFIHVMPRPPQRWFEGTCTRCRIRRTF